MTIPTLRPRVMRTQAGIAAVRSMNGPARLPSAYDPPGASPGGAQLGTPAPLRGASPTPVGQPGAAPQGRIQVAPTNGPVRAVAANAGQRSVGSTYAAGGQPILPGMAVGGRPNRPSSPQPETFSAVMARAAAAARRLGTPTAANPLSAAGAVQATTPATAQQPAQGGSSGGSSGGKAPSPRRQNKREQPEQGEQPEDTGFAQGGGGLAADADGDGQADNPAADDTPDNGQDMTEQQRRARAEAAGFDVSADGDVYTRGVDQEWVGNINDDESWAAASQQYAQLQDGADVDLSRVPEENQAGVEAMLATGDYWVDTRTGEVYLRQNDGGAYPDKNASVGNIYTGSFTGKAKADYESAASNTGNSSEEILREILGWDATQESDAALQEKIAANRAETQYATAQAMQNALGAGGRARMGAGWMAGTAGDLSAQGNLAAQQQAADLRLEHERRNVAAQMDLLNKQYGAILAMAGYSDNAAARRAAADLQAAQASLQKRLDELNYQRSQQIGWKDILGLGGNMLGTGLGMLAGRYIYSGNGGE